MNLFLKYKYVFFIAISFILYGNTIYNDYSLDDRYVTENNITTKGLSSIYKIFTTHYDTSDDGKGYEYRPIVKLSYAIEHEFLGVNPHTSHFVNILLYALCLILLYKALVIIFSETKIDYVFVTVLIFAVLPIHTEVVASLKNRDILLCFILSFYSFMYFGAYQKNKTPLNLGLAVILLFLAFLSKLDALPLLLIFPILLVKKNDLSLKTIFIVALLVILIFLGSKLFQNLMLEKNTTKRLYSFYENPLYINKTFTLKLSAALNSFGFYCKMLLIPTNLNSYYGYNTIPVNNFISGYSLFGFIAGFSSLIGLYKYRKLPQHPVFVGLVFFLCSISMYLNVVRPAPGIVADRFLFFASVGFAIILSHYIFALTSNSIKEQAKHYPAKFIGLLLIVFLGSASFTIKRNQDWKNLKTLLEADIKKNPNSVKLNVLYANELISEITRKNSVLSQNQKLLNVDLAKKYLNRAYSIDSSYYNISSSLGFIELTFFNNTKTALNYFYKSYKNKPYKFETCLNLGLCYVKQNNHDSAQHYFIKAYSLKPSDKSLKTYLYNYYKSIGQEKKLIYLYSE